jgi:lysyl-tRNA synthetase class 2
MTEPTENAPTAPYRTRTEAPLLAERIAKVDEIRARGENPFANGFVVSHAAAELFAAHREHDHDHLASLDASVQVAGRVRFVRRMGKALFIKIQDRSCRPDVKPAWAETTPTDDFLQIFVSAGVIGAERFAELADLDLGDIVGVSGGLMRTRTGELSVNASSVLILTKSIRPMPTKFGGLHDIETRYRQRYVDLILNEESREIFLSRVEIVKQMRRWFEDHAFLEVETPMLHTTLGGANAKPFMTHHNALDMPLYLRIAPELHLKRLLVGGMERVFEINRNFRNEGLSRQHNPEFTMIEFYMAYATCDDLLGLTEELIMFLANCLKASPWTPEADEDGVVPANRGVHLRDGELMIRMDGKDISLRAPFARVSIPAAVAEKLGVEVSAVWDVELLRKAAADAHLSVAVPDAGNLIYALFEHHCESSLVQPTFVVDFPASVSPLARRQDANPELVDRFELYVGGREIANGFSELNDPEDQYGRFADQLEAHAAGDEETMHMDEDYIRALEYGMPPAAGEGIGIDRLVMILTGAPSIRDVLLFPHMRPE